MSSSVAYFKFEKLNRAIYNVKKGLYEIKRLKDCFANNCYTANKLLQKVQYAANTVNCTYF